MNYEVVVKTDTTEANEPLIKDLVSTDYIREYIPDDLSNAEQLALAKKMCIAARQICEQFTGLSLAQKTLVVTFGNKHVSRRDRRITLPFPPHSTMTSVKTVDMEGTESDALVRNTGYYRYGNLFWEIEFATIIGTVNAITSSLDYKIEYVCGYGITGTNATMTLPETLRIAMAQQVGDWWKNRENWIPVLSSQVKQILWTYKRSGMV